MPPLSRRLFLAPLPAVLSAKEDPQAYAARFAAEINRPVALSPAVQDFYAAYLSPHPELAPNQFVALVDRNPKSQLFLLYWRAPAGPFRFLGACPVSTGLPGRFEYFLSPLGLFEHSLAHPDFRAEGTKNEYGIRGYGEKGMRVYDFGWVRANKTWGDRRESALRLQMHATDPDRLEPRLGIPLSKGCIRIPTSLNRFLDRYGILDAAYLDARREGRRLWVLPPDWNPTPWAGRYLVIVDSSSVWLTL
jgi:hypothetical protein